MLEAWVLCLAFNIYFEARGEPIDGQFLVAMVTWNRAGGKPENICREVYRPAAFSWTAKRPPLPKTDDAAFRHAVRVAELSAYMGDWTHGANHYHTLQVFPDWARWPRLEVGGSVGNHIYYRPRIQLQ